MVIGRGSSFACEAFAHDTSRVGQELGVRYLLEGSIRRAGNRLRITGQLIHSRGGDQIWADRHDGSLDDILELQTAIAAQIAGSIVPEIQHAELRRAERLPIASVQAYDLALKASALIARGIIRGSDTSVGSDRAGAGSDRVRSALSSRPLRPFMGLLPARGDRRHRSAACTGISITPTRPRCGCGSWTRAIMPPTRYSGISACAGCGTRKRLRICAAPMTQIRNDVTTLRWLSWEELNWGLADDAREHAELSIRLSPRDRLIHASYWTLALAAFVAGDCAGCITHAKKAIALNRQFTGYYLLVAACLAENAALEEARAAVEEIRRLTPDSWRAAWKAGPTSRSRPLRDRYRRALERAAGLAAGQHKPIRRRAGRRTDRPGTRGVLSLIAQGLSNARIAAALDLSEHTVKRHVANILLKLDLPTRSGGRQLGLQARRLDPPEAGTRPHGRSSHRKIPAPGSSGRCRTSAVLVAFA